jgi:hypothetical protein
MGIDNLENFHSMIEVLKKEGAPDIAAEIKDALTGANMGTEMYGTVSLVLKKVAQSQVSEMTKARAVKMRKEIAQLIKIKPDDL